MRIIRNILAFCLACFLAAFVWSAFSHGAQFGIDGLLDKLPDIASGAWRDSTRAAITKDTSNLHPIYGLLGRLPALPLAFAVLSCLPALLVTQYADNHGIRSWTYYALAALIIGVGAYWLADAFNVTPEHTQANAIGTLAFAAAALAYATTFWLFSGRYAGRDRAYIIPEPVATRDMKFKVEATKTS